MRIDSNAGGPQIPESNRSSPSQPAAGSGGAPAAGAASADQAQLSGAHVLAQALAAQASQLPEVRQEKVSALRQALQSGEYHPSPEKTADALFSHLLEARAA